MDVIDVLGNDDASAVIVENDISRSRDKNIADIRFTVFIVLTSFPIKFKHSVINLSC